ncbi:TPA: deoxynucleoside kinase, partial [Staphylococcus aureus]|nr:deoxynucleoside kinase [Staphylococcus aureus]
VLKARIAKRNRSFEHQIEDEYLLKLKKDYREYYESLQSNGSNVVLIDTTSIDFLKNEQDYEDILHIILPMIGDITNE